MKDNEKKGLTILTERIIMGQLFRIYGTVENPMFLVTDIARAIDHSKPSKLVDIVDDSNKIKTTLLGTQGSYQNSQGGLRANRH